MDKIYNMDIYTLGTFGLCAFVVGVFAAAAIGGWLERRKFGRRPFVVRVLRSDKDWDDLERILFEEHQKQIISRIQ